MPFLFAIVRAQSFQVILFTRPEDIKIVII